MRGDGGKHNLKRNQLADVICQLRFPEIPAIGSDPPQRFRELIADQYPDYSMRKETPPPRIRSHNGQLNINASPVVFNHQFTSPDGNWRVNITNDFFSVACNRYNGWESFASRLDKPLAVFLQIYRPECFQRVGLRYLNFISRKNLGLENTPFRELIQSPYIGYLSKLGVEENQVAQSTLDAQFSLPGGCAAKIHTGPGMITLQGKPDPEMKFVLDIDLFINGKIPVNVSVGAMQTLHDHAFPIFREMVTDKLMDALRG